MDETNHNPVLVCATRYFKAVALVSELVKLLLPEDIDQLKILFEKIEKAIADSEGSGAV